MKILWFSNCVLSKTPSAGSGSWLFAMRDLIVNDVDLINITDSNINKITLNEANGIKEYILPNWKLKNGVPTTDHIIQIADIIDHEKPDVVHIWGVEKYWALLFSRGLIQFDKVILEIQGVFSSCVDVYYGGLLPIDIIKMMSLKSLLFSKYRLSKAYRSYQMKSLYEKELVRSFKHIAIQSNWTKDQLSTICSEKTNYYYSLRPIRKQFYQADKWKKPSNSKPILFCSISYYKPFKGLHFLLKALNVVRCYIPNITLRIAGPNLESRPFYLIGDYERYILKEIRRLELVNNIVFCGSLNATQMVEEIQNADIVVNPSLVESYSAAAAEALYLGAPTILAYSGAMINFSEEKPVALYYNPMDYRSLAAKISTLLYDQKLRNILTLNALEELLKKSSPDSVKSRQLDTYNKVLNSSL